jgi:hypothetical protein
MSGLKTQGMGRPAPGLDALTQYRAYLADAKEVIWQPQYDFQAYAQAGQQTLSFFQVPNGQNGKTYADTNMDMAGQLPAGMNFLCTGIEIQFYPGGALEFTAANGVLDDQYSVMKSGYLEFKLLQKNYLREAPLAVFPPLTGLVGFAATNLAAAGDGSLIAYARNSGPTYQITPIAIPSSQNFSVVLNWPTAIAVSVAGRIGVRLLGYTYRNSQ